MRTLHRAALALLATCSIAAAQQPPTLQVYSRETIVDVSVTDNKGRPIHGLTESDFTVKEDGHPESLRSFKEFNAEDSTPSRAVPKLPPHVYTNIAATPATGPVNIILLDALNTADPAQMQIIKTEIPKYLKTMPQGSAVAIFSLTATKGLQLVQGFTTDAATAAASAEKSSAEWIRPTTGELRVPPARITFEALNRLNTYASGIKGRKNLLWVTAAMPILITRDGGVTLQRDPPPTFTFKEIAQLYDRFTAAQFSVTGIDAHGLDSGMDTMRSGPGPGVGAGPSAVSMAANNLDSVSRGKGMEEVAAQNGGIYLRDSSDFKSLLKQAIENGDNFYTLSYVPPPFPNDTRFHTIQIKVDRPGVHLVYRSGYNALDPAKSPSPEGPKLMQAALGGGVPPVTQLLFDVRVEPSPQPAKPADPPVLGVLNSKLKNQPLTRYDVLYFFPATQITFADAAGHTYSGSVEFDLVAADPLGNIVSSRSQTMPLPLTADEYRQFLKTPFQFFQQLDLPPGQLTLRVGILDTVSNKIGTLELPLTVTPTQHQTPAP